MRDVQSMKTAAHQTEQDFIGTGWLKASRLGTIVWVALLLLGGSTLSLRAGGWYHHYPHYSHGWGRPAFSFSYGGPYYGYAPYGYGYYGYGTYDYVYRRPNYAVTGTLLGALAGGLIGNSIHHQGWEGAGIGAAAGLVLGGLAEGSARQREQAYSTVPTLVQPAPVANAATVPSAPVAPAAPTVPNTPALRMSGGTMSGANSLFGR